MSKKLALLIGINYRGSDAELSGCINDVLNMKEFLLKHCDYAPENITLLTEDTPKKPTAMNILRELGRIIVAAYYHQADEIFIHYSGHGSYIVDVNGDETDKRDETLVPLDYETAGQISDDLLHDYFSYIPAECRCICLFDCCHSGTMLDLQYRYIQTDDNEIENKNSTVKGDVIMISGCRDIQTSADAFIEGKWSGAMTASFLDTMKKYNYNVSCFHLLNSMREYLEKNGYEQVPQICSSIKITNTSIFASHKSQIPYFVCH